MPFGLCNAPATFQICMMTIFHDIVKVFMDYFSVFGESFELCLTSLDRIIAILRNQSVVELGKVQLLGYRRNCVGAQGIQQWDGDI